MPKAARAYWKGFLRLSLVTIGVEIYNAVESKADISFRQIHKPSGKRVNYEKVVQGIGKIESGDIVKGYEVDKDTYVTLDPEEIDAVKLESKKTIDLVQFVDAKDIDYRYFERPYFITPTDELSGEGYVVIRDALRKTGKVGLAQITIAGREWLVAIAPLEDGLVMEMLRYADELRKPADLLRRGAGYQARQGDGRPCRAAHRQEVERVQAGQIRGPLSVGAQGAAAGQAQGPQDRRPRAGAAQGRQHRRPDGSAEEEYRRAGWRQERGLAQDFVWQSQGSAGQQKRA